MSQPGSSTLLYQSCIYRARAVSIHSVTSEGRILKSYLILSSKQKRSLPAEFANDDVRYTEELVKHFLEAYTKPGDVVFDPFMGYGTTLLAAENLGRLGYGVEFDQRRWHYVQSLVKSPERALLGDSTKLALLDLPEFDFSMTSPPYMGRHHKENPFTAYTTQFSGYDQYLADLTRIYADMKGRLKPGARAVIEVSNLKHEDKQITTLAWDIAQAVGKVLTFEGEVIAIWEDGSAYGYEHSYCLIFSKPLT